MKAPADSSVGGFYLCVIRRPHQQPHPQSFTICSYKDFRTEISQSSGRECDCGSASKAGSRLVMLRYSKVVSKAARVVEIGVGRKPNQSAIAVSFQSLAGGTGEAPLWTPIYRPVRPGRRNLCACRTVPTTERSSSTAGNSDSPAEFGNQAEHLLQGGALDLGRDRYPHARRHHNLNQSGSRCRRALFRFRYR